jgi:TetR/AcrR family tetracycline transcriptional repressor
LSSAAAVQACRLLMWATVGFVAMEQGSSAPAPDAPAPNARRRLSGSDPGGVTPEEADELFDLQIGILTAGIARSHAGDMAGDTSGD